MQPGARVGEWVVQRELGRGSFGAVFEARHATRGDRGALKILLRPVDETDFRRFTREYAAGAVVTGPNVVRVIAAGREGGRPFIVLELAAGGTLERRIKEAGRLPWREVARVGAGVARGLAALHGAGFVHRDLKPANILFDEQGTPKVADFGLVRPAEGGSILTASNLVVGTPAFLSPEQANGIAATEASDVYSLGCTLHAALAGAPPFRKHGVGVLKQHLAEAPPDVRAEAPEVPEAFAGLLLRCLAKAPAQRPTPAELVGALETLGAADPKTEEAAAPRAGVALAALLVLGALALAAAFVARKRPAEDAPPPPPAAVAPTVTAPWPRRPRATGEILPLGTTASSGLGPSLVAREPRRPAPADVLASTTTLTLAGAWGSTDWIHGGPIAAAGFVGDESVVTAGHPEYNVRLWRRDGVHLTTWGARGGVRCLVVGPRDTVFVGDVRGAVTIHRGSGPNATRVVAQRKRDCPVLAITLSFGDQAIVVWADGLARIVSPDGDHETLEAPREPPEYVAGAISSRDSLVLLVDKGGHALLRSLDPRLGSERRIPLEDVRDVAIDNFGRFAIFLAGKKVYAIANPVEPGSVPADLHAETLAEGEEVESVFNAADGSAAGFVTASAVFRYTMSTGTTPQRIPIPQDNVRAFCGPGGRLLVASRTGPFRIWEPGGGGRVVGEANPLGRTHGVAVSDDGRSLATVSEDGIVTVWRGGDRPVLRPVVARPGLRGAELSPTGALLAVRGDFATTVFSTRDGSVRATYGTVRRASLTDDGTTLLVQNDGVAVLWSGEVAQPLGVGAIGGQLAKDGRHAALVTSSALTILELGAPAHPIATTTFAVPAVGGTADLDPTWSKVAIYGRTERERKTTSLHLYDAATGELVAIDTPHAFGIIASAFDARGELYATAGFERRVCLWRTRDGAKVGEYNLGPLVTDHAAGLAFTADGKLVATSSRGQILLFDVAR